MQSRLAHSLKNVFAIWLGQLVSVLCTFIVRMVFVRYLAQDYLGLETLFSNVLSILSLAELGVGSAIVFSLYEPLANNDKEVVKSLMRLFRRAYTAIGVFIFVVGMSLTPFIGNLINNLPDIPNLHFYYMFFVVNTSVSYFFIYKGSLITADQKNYIVSLIRYSVQLLLSIAQGVILVLTSSYELFLTAMLVATLTQNLAISFKADQMYPYIKEKDVQPIDKKTLDVIKKNILGMMVHKSSSVVNAPVNGVVISKLVGLSQLAVYGNYLLVMNALAKIVDQMFDAVVSSIGNLGVTETKERQYEIFKLTHFANAFLYGALAVCFLPLVTPFVQIAFGENYLFPFHLAVLFALWFYFRGMRDAALSFISAYGLYWQTKTKALCETITLLTLGPALTMLWGVEGLLLANILVQICISIVCEATILFKHGFGRSVFPYFRRLGIYAFATLCLTAASCFIVAWLPLAPLFQFLVGGVISVIIGFGGFALLFGRTPEYKDIIGRVRGILGSRIPALAKKSKEE